MHTHILLTCVYLQANSSCDVESCSALMMFHLPRIRFPACPSAAEREMLVFQRSLSIFRFCRSGSVNKYSTLRSHSGCSQHIAERVAKAEGTATRAHATDNNSCSEDVVDSDTIAAVVTGGHDGGVAIIRMSGQSAVQTASKLFHRSAPPSNGGTSPRKYNGVPFSPASHRIYYGHVVDSSGQVLDEVLLLPMLKPRSYTREDVVELHCHGGGICAQRILEECLQHGCRLAAPGEFTLRAFLNGRLDLSQAESVAQLVTARTSSAADSALAGLKAISLQGGIATEIRSLRLQLVELLAEIEARIDFDDEVPPVDTDKLSVAVAAVQQSVEDALQTARRGRVLRGGVQVAIVGRPNVGKSSLLNKLCGSDRAIVTDIPGTTRDVVDVQVDINGIPMTLLDTAGMRSTADTVEAMGVVRSERAANAADVIVFVYDSAVSWSAADSELFDKIFPSTDENSSKPAILAANKRDLVQGEVDTQPLPARCQQRFENIVSISATAGTNLGALQSSLESAALTGKDNEGKGHAWAVNERQAAVLIGARQSLLHLKDTIQAGLPLDFWTIDLRAAVDLLGEVTGDVVTEEILDTVFSKFCIGK